MLNSDIYNTIYLSTDKTIYNFQRMFQLFDGN